ncbi:MULTISPECIES: alpha/beta hydrolase family protein [Salinibaculum]|uniref:alpha/beta hydrolase family protein n=1 Tax=Salinibaculum TaxID=2732368 RepID=UPI0030CF163E
MPTTHRIPVADDESVVAVHHEAPTDAWLVFCHGFLSDKSGSYEGRCERAVEAGYNAVRFDFRGCGEADGAFVDQTLSDKLADLRAVVDHFDPDRYALFGSSFGGKVAFHAAAAADRVTAIATRAPVTYNRAFDGYRASVAREGSHAFDTGQRIAGRFFDDFDQYPFDAVVGNLSVPVAIFHGAADESVPVGDSFEAAQHLQTDVLLQKFVDEGHRFSRPAEAQLRDLLFDWLATVGAGES